jgi:hypothetical protein
MAPRSLTPSYAVHRAPYTRASRLFASRHQTAASRIGRTRRAAPTLGIGCLECQPPQQVGGGALVGFSISHVALAQAVDTSGRSCFAGECSCEPAALA